MVLSLACPLCCRSLVMLAAVQAREIAPAIIFIDEIDAIGRTRGGSQGNNERDQTLNMLLTELDGFEEDTGVIIMGATNRKDVLDPALIRAGRFDRIILVGRPDYDGRIEILKVLTVPTTWTASLSCGLDLAKAPPAFALASG